MIELETYKLVHFRPMGESPGASVKSGAHLGDSTPPGRAPRNNVCTMGGRVVHPLDFALYPPPNWSPEIPLQAHSVVTSVPKTKSRTNPPWPNTPRM